MIEFFRSACLALRQGASLRPEMLALARLELQQRSHLQTPLPAVFQPYLETLRESLAELAEVLDGLDLASREDAPELAGWLNLRAQNAWERILSVEQQLGDYYATLDEELHHGDR